MLCFNGCSFTYGEGFSESDRIKYTYPYTISNEYNTPIENIAIKGSSNYLIFMRSAEAIQSGRFSAVFTQWSALNRLWLFPGPDTSYFTADEISSSYSYREIHLSTQRKKTFNDTIRMLNGDYQNLFDLVDYCKILDSLALKNNVQTYYVNGLLPWTPDLFDVSAYDNMENDFSLYTKQILDFDHRSDAEITHFHHRISKKLKTLNTKNWINMFSSILSNIVDRTPVNQHPGIKTNEWVANKIIKYMEQHGIN